MKISARTASLIASAVAIVVTATAITCMTWTVVYYSLWILSMETSLIELLVIYAAIWLSEAVQLFFLQAQACRGNNPEPSDE